MFFEFDPRQYKGNASHLTSLFMSAATAKHLTSVGPARGYLRAVGPT
jgi:hypothetical protein